MHNYIHRKSSLLAAAACAGLVTILPGCGGGGGGSNVMPSNNIEPEAIPRQPININDSGIAGSLKQQLVINADDVWSLGHFGEGVTIAVVDSGVNPNHYDFYGDNGFSRIDYQNARGVESEDGSEVTFNGNYVDIDNPDYHGTHISSIALGREYGVAPKATLLPVNVFFDNETAYNDQIWAAVDYSASMAPIVNTSIRDMVNLATFGDSNSELNQYISTFKNQDSVLVAVAGNGGADSRGDPVGAEHFENFNSFHNLSIQDGLENKVLTVIALNDFSRRASFSNYPGSCDDVGFFADVSCNEQTMSQIQQSFIAAPAVGIEAADGFSNTGTKVFDGTSMSVPIVSSSLALLMSSWDQLTPQQAVAILKESANRDFFAYSPEEYGVGILDVGAAFEPSGELKSTASFSSDKSYTINQSTAQLSKSLSGLKKLSSLTSVAYFDKYNRDYQVDLTSNLNSYETAIDWQDYWTHNQQYPQALLQAKDFSIRYAFNPSSANALQSLTLTNDNTELSYLQTSFQQPINHQIQQAPNLFMSNLSANESSVFAISHHLNNNYQLVASYSEPVNQTLLNQNTQSRGEVNQAAFGVISQASDNLKFAASVELEDAREQFLDSYGQGVFAMGEQNRNFYHRLSAVYQLANMQFFGHLKQGALKLHKSSDGSFVKIDSANYGQLQLGLSQQHLNSTWGIQVFNDDPLHKADFSITTPIGIGADGQIQYQHTGYSHRSELKPDSVELFYHQQFVDKTHFQWNLINTPDDRGLGLMVRHQF